MFGVELTGGWIVAAGLYFLGSGMMAWGARMGGRKTSRSTFFALVVTWPIVALIGTILFLFPSLDEKVRVRGAELQEYAERIKRAKDTARRRRDFDDEPPKPTSGPPDQDGPPQPPAFGGA